MIRKVEDLRTISTSSINRVFTPKKGIARPSPRRAEQGNVQDALNPTEFTNLVLIQMKRLDPLFTFEFIPESPLIQAAQFIAQAVDLLLSEKSALKLSPANDPDSEANRWLKEEIEKAKETTKNLTRYERLLKKKEEKLEEQQIKLKSEKIRIKDMEEQLKTAVDDIESQTRIWTANKQQESELIKKDREEADKLLKDAKIFKEKLERKIDETTQHLLKEKENLVLIETSLNQTKLSLIADQKRITNEKLVIEKEKWSIDQRQRKLEEIELVLNIKTENLENEKNAIEFDRQKLYQTKKSLEDDKKEILLIRDEVLSYDKDSKNSSIKRSDKRAFESQDLDSKVFELEEREREIEQAYRELHEQMDNFNRELEEREILLDEREFSIAKQEKDLKRKVENLQVIEASLAESRLQLEDMRNITMPELERQSELLEAALQELSQKKIDLEDLIEKVASELMVLTKEKGQLRVIEEDNSMSSLEINRDFEEITQELERKLQKVKDRERELDKVSGELVKERESVVKAAELLRKTQVEVKEAKISSEKEIFEEKEKIRQQLLKLEAGMRLLATKEEEVFAFKRKLDDKSQMLTIKEKELNSLIKCHENNEL